MKHSNQQATEENYWQSMADSLVALLLCILLIMLLLMLYLVRIDENQQIDDKLGNSYQKYDDPDDGSGNDRYGYVDNSAGDTYNHDSGHDNGGWGGWGGGTGGDWEEGDGDEDFQFEDPDPGAGEGEGLDRAAVLVQVIDSETERTIKKEGIAFELYKYDAVLQVLSTYYPKKISYKQYKTDSSGVFYLPERLIADTYYLQCLTAIPGYDIGDNSNFTIDKAYDWEDPFVVNVRLQPSKNVIELHLKDASDGKNVAGATFQIIAAENITTADGTLRYQENTVVDTISIGSDGIGRSQELFLGSYLVRQTGIPEYYGKVAEEKLVILKTRSDSKQREAVTLYEEKTSMEIALVDELFESIPLAGASLSLRSVDGEVLQQLTTNAQGKAVLRNLKKNTTYYLRQESAPDGYRMNLKDLSFRVSSDGFIDGSVSAARTITNRTLRISVAIQDKLFRSYVSDVNLVLMDAEGNILKNWSSTGLEQRFDGIGQGQYKLVMGGDVDGAVTITVEDTAEIQEFRLERWTTTDIAVLVSAAALAVGGLVLLVWLLRRRKGNKEGGDA